LQVMLSEHHFDFDFHQTNPDIHISTLSDSWTIRFVQFSHKFRMIITPYDIKNLEGCGYQWQQWRIARRIYKVNVGVIAMGMRNRLSKARGSIDKNLTGCLQRYIVFQYERMIKYLILNTNNVAFQIIPNEHNFDFHRGPREICRPNPTWLDGPTRRFLSDE
jgi:hypothetical protein